MCMDMVVRPDEYLIWMSFLPAVEQYEAETFLNPKFWNGTVATCLPRAMLKKQNRKARNLSVSSFLLVRVAGFEPTAEHGALRRVGHCGR